MVTPLEDEPIIIDMDLLRRVARERWAYWAKCAAILFVLVLAYGAFAMPQKFTATCSLAIESGGAASSALALFTGQSGIGKRYVGILKSRWAATQVEQQVDLKSLYHLKTERAAIQRLQKSVSVDDLGTDGLVYVTVTLSGPARFRPFSAARRAQVKKACALAANDYAAALLDYYEQNDTDRESVLLRDADTQTTLAWNNYNAAFARLKQFSAQLDKVDPRAVPSPDVTTTGTQSESELVRLYSGLEAVQAEISASQAADATQQRLTEGQLSDVALVPSEDPLLTSARAAVRRDQDELDRLLIQFGPDHPLVRQEQANLQIDQERLNQQIGGIEQNKTTRQVLLKTDLQALEAKEAAYEKQIAGAEQRLPVTRQLTGDYLSLRSDLDIALEVLKATMTEAAKVRLDNVAARNRMTVVDPAITPLAGAPGPLIILIIDVLLAALIMVFGIGSSYLSEARRRARMRKADAVRQG